jgi:hypothetical protein
MANRKHLAKLKEGPKTWNEWRAAHPKMRPDLSGAALRGEDLIDADLCRARLSATDLSGADLSEEELDGLDLSGAELDGANLFGTTLNRADFSGTSMMEANLVFADLTKASLKGANLNGANLSEATIVDANLNAANLVGAILHWTDLSGSDLTRAQMGYTVFGENDLSMVEGLETVRHDGPSTIGIDTIYRSKAKIPESFLRGCGVPDDFITFAKSLASNPIEFYSCFISYSKKDDAFAAELHAQLQAQHIRCWKDSEDLKIGAIFQEEIDSAIQSHDKLLLVLSENSINSSWVEWEVRKALKKEQEQGSTVLFPVRLDDAVLEAPYPWAAEVRKRHIGDFRKWKDHDSFQKSLDRLLRDLRAQEYKPK